MCLILRILAPNIADISKSNQKIGELNVKALFKIWKARRFIKAALIKRYFKQQITNG